MWLRRAPWVCHPPRQSSATVPKMLRLTAGCCCRAITVRVTTRTPASSTQRCSKACSSGRFRSDVLGKPPIKVGPPVSEKPEGGAVLFGRCEIERRDQRARLLSAELGERIAALVADEAVAVEALPAHGAEAVGGDHPADLRR